MSDGSTPGRSSTARRAAIGAGWLYAFRWIERMLDFLALAVLARLLSPDDFGLVAIAASFVAIIEGLAAFDVQKALIRSRDDRRALFDSAWTLSALRGLLAALVMLAVAPLLGDPRIAAILGVLALSPLLGGLQNPRFVTFERNLDYSKLALLTVVSKLGAVAVTLSIAIATRSYWALVVGMLVGTCLGLVLSYALRPYRPRLELSRWRTIFGFSGWLSLTTAVTTLSMETDKLIIGRLLGVADAGRYFMTQRVGVLPTRELIGPLQRLLFPSFAELAPDPVQLRRVVRESVNVVGSLSLPAGCGFAVVADDVVPLVLGAQWLDLVPLLQILVPYLGARATLSIALPCMLALGYTRLLFWVSTAYALIHVPTFVAGTFLYGLVGSIWSLVVAGIAYTALNVWMLRRAVDLGLGALLAQLRRPAAATLAMVGALLALETIPAVAALGPIASLALSVPLGGLVYAAVAGALWHLGGRPRGLERRLVQLAGEALRARRAD
ncbi:MAG: lipopolysaccharide biosynthesis protein [Acidobacteriota bacterium]